MSNKKALIYFGCFIFIFGLNITKAFSSPREYIPYPTNKNERFDLYRSTVNMQNKFNANTINNKNMKKNTKQGKFVFSKNINHSF